MYTIAWLLFILTCIVAVPIAALIDSQQRKKAQREALMADENQLEPQSEYDDAEGVMVAEDVEAVEAVAEPIDEAVPVAEGLPAADADDLFGQDLPK